MGFEPLEARLLLAHTADAEILPMRFADLAGAVTRYVGEVQKLADSEREEGRKLKGLLDAGAFRLAGDPQVTYLAPTAPGDVPRLDFRALVDASAHLRRSALAYDAAFEWCAGTDFLLPSGEVSELNALLQGVEQALTSKAGLPGRDWYQHMLYAPGLYTGYGVKTLPGVRESIEEKQWKLAEEQAVRVGKVLENAGEKIQSAAAAIGQGAP